MLVLRLIRAAQQLQDELVGTEQAKCQQAAIDYEGKVQYVRKLPPTTLSGF